MGADHVYVFLRHACEDKNDTRGCKESFQIDGFKIDYEGQQYNAFLFGGPGQEAFEDRSGFGYPAYHGTIQQYKNTLDRLESIEVDVWLGDMPHRNETFAKMGLLKKGARPNPYIDPEGWKAHLRGLRESLERFPGCGLLLFIRGLEPGDCATRSEG